MGGPGFDGGPGSPGNVGNPGSAGPIGQPGGQGMSFAVYASKLVQV